MTATATSTAAPLGAALRRAAERAHADQVAADALRDATATWEADRLDAEAAAAVRRIATTSLARMLHVHPDALGTAEVTSHKPITGYVGNRGVDGTARFDLGDGLRFEVAWKVGNAYVNLLVGCAHDGCGQLALGPNVTQLDTLPRELDDPGAHFCDDHDVTF